MDKLPRAPGWDSSLAFLRRGYAFIGLTCDALGRDVFATRLMLRPVICMRGPEAMAAFYAPGRFTRRGAVPAATVSLLQDFGSVQMLDGEAHRRRKRMFLSLMQGERLAAARLIFAEEWKAVLAPGGEVSLLDAAHLILCRTALRWCGLEDELPQAERHTTALRAMIEGAGSFGLAQARGQLLRRRAERWARRIIAARRTRAGGTTPADVIAAAQGEDSAPLPANVAAVELINLLRPIVAVARFVAFAAHAIHLHPEWRRSLVDIRTAHAFTQEVRRFYPFFPCVGGKVLVPFSFRGIRFARGQWVLFDIYGSNHHRSWGDPERFRPERFLDDRLAETQLVAQGGGDRLKGHRCAGEDLTVVLLEEACRLLARMDYRVPEQDLSIPLDRFPTAPRGGMRIILG